jgi:hypothetical protein
MRNKTKTKHKVKIVSCKNPITRLFWPQRDFEEHIQSVGGLVAAAALGKILSRWVWWREKGSYECGDVGKGQKMVENG